MWEELATSENLDAKLWPRLAAIAERFWSPQSVTDVNSMYARLEPTNHWLEWLGLTQRSNLELMRQRLAGNQPVQPLDRFAAILEPVKGYARHAEKYSSSTPLNRLVDSIPPESKAAREFRNAVDQYLAMPKEQRSGGPLQRQLTAWQENLKLVRPMLQANTILTENVPVADAIDSLCSVGGEAFSYLDANTTAAPPANWKTQSAATVQEASQRKGDLLVQIAPAIQKLVDAVPEVNSTTPTAKFQ